MRIIIMGPPGSGKSTQAELLAKSFNLPHIETGAIYREVAKTNPKVKEILDRGLLIDDQTTFEVVDRHLAEIKTGFVLEGFPRTLVQAKRNLFPIDKIFYLRLSNQEATNRLISRARPDETIDIINERLLVYHQMTEPVLDYYKVQGNLVEIDDSGTIDQVHNLILQSLEIND